MPDARPFFSMFAASSPEKRSKWQKNNKRLLMIRHSHIMDTSMTTSVLSRRRDIAERYAKTSWEQILFSEFSTSLESSNRPFPCIFGVRGFKLDQLRYVFQENLDLDLTSAALKEFVRDARSFGPNTSLVIFTRPEEIKSIDAYQEEFWKILKGLADRDHTPWPEHMPTEITHPEWEFCFAGEPVFVVCNTPAHIFRQSRRASSFMLTFQPRWVFDKILGTEKSTQTAFGAVRKRIAHYDFLPVSPKLGRYGHPGVLESEQYFLDDRNQGGSSCPFQALGERHGAAIRQ
ncbi:YqcI/YcgG family protein [Verminephrobacter eiseniae]|uniref:YqcI/YcgG family protein n=2 Tax=Verminephrobacter eiseniae TaxID=364317 RepID=UPI00223857F7|nr:YqcI/YcgG family protein [Verminephrobacter eiseniae]